MKKKSVQKLKIQLDADVARLSQLLALKEAFRAHPGENPIEIAFMTARGKISALHIDKNWGVESRKELESKISAISSVKGFSWEIS